MHCQRAALFSLTHKPIRQLWTWVFCKILLWSSLRACNLFCVCFSKCSLIHIYKVQNMPKRSSTNIQAEAIKSKGSGPVLRIYINMETSVRAGRGFLRKECQSYNLWCWIWDHMKFWKSCWNEWFCSRREQQYPSSFPSFKLNGSDSPAVSQLNDMLTNFPAGPYEKALHYQPKVTEHTRGRLSLTLQRHSVRWRWAGGVMCMLPPSLHHELFLPGTSLLSHRPELPSISQCSAARSDVLPTPF